MIRVLVCVCVCDNIIIDSTWDSMKDDSGKCYLFKDISCDLKQRLIF